jgi:hypothetical protein
MGEFCLGSFIVHILPATGEVGVEAMFVSHIYNKYFWICLKLTCVVYNKNSNVNRFSLTKGDTLNFCK